MSRQMRMLFGVLAILLVGASVAAWLAFGSATVTPDQLVAARFAGVAVERVTPLRTEPLRLASPGGARLQTTWTAPPPRLAQVGVERVTLRVDIDLGYVSSMLPQSPPASAAAGNGPAATLAESVVLQRARSFLESVETPWQGSDPLVTSKDHDTQAGAVKELAWRGPGPEEFQHWVEVRMSMINGSVLSYSASIDPPWPAATSEVRLSERDAENRVVQEASELWPDLTKPFQAKSYLLWTRSPFAAPGRPVYMVEIIGEVDLGRGRQGGFRTVCGVDAATGDVLQQPYRGSAPPPDSPPPKLSADAALERARAALPLDLTSPRLILGELTWETPVAPAGRRVYPVRVSGERPSATNPEEKVPWAMTWAVDANDGRIYGLGDRPLPDLPSATP